MLYIEIIIFKRNQCDNQFNKCEHDASYLAETSLTTKPVNQSLYPKILGEYNILWNIFNCNDKNVLLRNPMFMSHISF